MKNCSEAGGLLWTSVEQAQVTQWADLGTKGDSGVRVTGMMGDGVVEAVHTTGSKQ